MSAASDPLADMLQSAAAMQESGRAVLGTLDRGRPAMVFVRDGSLRS